ncbi:MAG: HD domain-containing protein [Spirochaetota bacterium]
MISKGLLEKLYQAATIQRWNDHVRPCELTELDKQAHKMAISYVIAKFEQTDRRADIDWLKIIEGGIFEFLHRVILTDIKPMVFHRMMSQKGRELNEFVLEQINGDIKGIPGGFTDRFRSYLFDPEFAFTEKRILGAAHYLATNWEFRIIYHLNPFIQGIEKTRAEIENRLEDYYDLIGVQKINLGRKSFGFIDLCGQLRFQKRWSGTPRIPQTSVLGHMLIVAMLSYLCSIQTGACSRRKYNNFFAGLFHDLAEVLTRDIISPVKKSVKGLKKIIKEYEQIQVEESLLPLLPQSWHAEVKLFIEDEFENKIVDRGEVVKGVSAEQLQTRYNHDRYFPVDGQIIRACDELSAFIEATLSINYGIKSPHLVQAIRHLTHRYSSSIVQGIDFGRLFNYFKQEAGSDFLE